MKVRFDLLLFDLGGVLVENEGPARLASWLPNITSDELILDQWLTSPVVRAFERGRMKPLSFADTVVKELALPITSSEFLTDFAEWVTQLYPGTENLLQQLAGSYKLGCLSNTNVLHWQRMSEVMHMDTLFDYHFVSYEMGLLKPDHEVFLHVIEQTGYAPERILYFDDSQCNVDSAEAVGIVARKTLGLTEVYSALNKDIPGLL